MAKKTTTPIQSTLFDEPGTVGTALRVQPLAARSSSPTAQAFNRALQRIEKLQQQIDDMQRHGSAHQAARAQALSPLRQQHSTALQQLLACLCTQLDAPPKGLTRLQLQTLRQVVCGLALNLLDQGVPDMQAVHDRYSPQSLDDLHKEATQAMRQHLEDMLDEHGLDRPTDSDDPEAVIGAAMEQLRERAAQEEAERLAWMQARQARRAQRAPSAKQQQTAQAQQDADTSLRQLYRQLASALHPDRESDPAQQQRKTALMGEVNAAYQRKDLPALLRLQLQAELVDPNHLDRISQDRLKQWTLLLKQQGAELDKQRQHEQQRWLATLGLPGFASLDPTFLQRYLAEEISCWEVDIDSVHHDLQRVGALASLKTWLNEQRRLAQRAERTHALAAF